jgi:DNA-binding PadR family transcriptional regulator
VAGYGSIYPALAELTRQGLVTCTDVEQAKRPAKKVYRLTDAGLQSFRAALAEAYPAHRVRSDFMVLMLFAHHLEPQRLVEVVEQRSADIDTMLAQIDSCGQEAPYDNPPAGAEFMRGFARAVLLASRNYIKNHRQQLFAAVAERVEDPKA